jgi:hypothetical protein
MNRFEHVILSLVSNVLSVPINEEYIEFYAGTLFIKNFGIDDANIVLNNLKQFGDIHMSKVGNEYAFDFV